MNKNYLTYQLGYFFAWQTMKIFSHGFYGKTLQLSLAERLSALLRRNSPEGHHHLYLLNTMKPINLPPSLSTGRATIVPLLLCNLREKILRKFPGF